MRKNKSTVFWGAMIIILILSAYIFPYTILSDVQKWYGSFLAWGVIGVLIIFANIMVTKNWRD